MMERYRTTLIMLALLIGLGVAAFLLNNNQAGNLVTPTPVATRYVWQSTDAVVGLDIVSGTQKVVLSGDLATGSWKLEQPVTGDADTFAVSTIADAFQSLEATSVLTEKVNLADFGLDPQGLTATVTYSGTTAARTLLIGSPTFDGAGYYAKIPEAETVYVVSNSTIEPLRSWLLTPPLAPPTPAPQLTIAPTPTVTPTGTVTSTPSASVVMSPTLGVITATVELTGTSPITSTSPGAANPTTPLPASSPSP